MQPDRTISATLYAYRTLRERIVALELKPGSPAGEQAIADLLGISRTPVREALARLAAEGLIDGYSRRGTVVAPIRLAAVAAAQFVRETLEAQVIREAALLPSPHHLFAVEQAIEEQAFAVAQDDPGLFFDADERMHEVFSRIASRDLVWPIIADAKKHMDRLRRLSVQTINLGALVADHRRILAAIKARDPDAADLAMRRHLRRVLQDLPALVERFGEYIDDAAEAERILARINGEQGLGDAT